MLGPYPVVGPLVAGGSSDVLAIDFNGQRAAAKWLLDELSRDARVRRAFEHEATLLALCHGPGLAALLGRDVIDARPVLFLRWIDGAPLDVTLPRSQRDALTITCATLDALATLHELRDERGPLEVVHRDVNPSNLLVDARAPSEVTLVDLGLASSRLFSRGAEGLSEGTLGYHAPEMFTGDAPIDARTDVFCAAIVLWELLAARPLFSRSKFAAAREIVETDAPDIREVRSDVSAQLAAVIAKALSRRAADRFRDARSFARALGR